MSVYKPKKSPFYQYDFQIRGNRFCGTTGLKSKRAAEAYELKERDKAEAAVEEVARRGAEPMTIAVACGRFWHEVGQHHAGEGAANTKRALRWIRLAIGEETRIADISDNTVAELVARRRGMKARNSKEHVANGTVNRSCTEPLRKVLSRAKDTWGETVQNIKWNRHMLPEPRERVRELSADEEVKLDASIREDFRPLFRFAVLTGMRLSECLRLTWKDIDWGNRLIRIHGKGGKIASIPLEPDVRALLFPLQAHVSEINEEAVFCYQVERSRGKLKAGEWRAITQSGLKTRWRRDRAQSGVEDYRWHDNRHTAATRVLRSSKNIRAVQKMLRHSALETTTKYAHVTDDDVRDALEAAAETRRERAAPPTRTGKKRGFRK